MFGFGNNSTKIWSDQEIDQVSAAMNVSWKSTHGPHANHGYSNRDIHSALRGMNFGSRNTDLDFVANQAFSILSGGGGN